jgi:hypothetical protein
MPRRASNQGNVIQALGRLVQAGAIVSFELDLLGEFNESAIPSLSVMVRAPNDLVPALQHVRDALEPLGVDATIRLSVWDADGGLDL